MAPALAGGARSKIALRSVIVSHEQVAVSNVNMILRTSVKRIFLFCSREDTAVDRVIRAEAFRRISIFNLEMARNQGTGSEIFAKTRDPQTGAHVRRSVAVCLSLLMREIDVNEERREKNAYARILRYTARKICLEL